MLDTDDTRRTTNDGRRTTPRVWHKLPTGELKRQRKQHGECGMRGRRRDKYDDMEGDMDDDMDDDMDEDMRRNWRKNIRDKCHDGYHDGKRKNRGRRYADDCRRERKHHQRGRY